jgi:hypothetical protein
MTSNNRFNWVRFFSNLTFGVLAIVFATIHFGPPTVMVMTLVYFFAFGLLSVKFEGKKGIRELIGTILLSLISLFESVIGLQ